MKNIWKSHRILVILLLLATLLTGFFGTRLVLRGLYWSDPAHHEQRIEGWMTVGYIGRSWHVDPRAIERLAGLPPPVGKPMPLMEIAEARGVALAQIIAEVETAVATLAAQKP